MQSLADGISSSGRHFYSNLPGIAAGAGAISTRDKSAGPMNDSLKIHQADKVGPSSLG